MRNGHAVDARVSPGVDAWISAVTLRANARTRSSLAQRVRTHTAWHGTCVTDLRCVRERPPIRQPLAGLLAIPEAVDVRRAADESIGNAMAILVHDDARIEVAVTIRIGAGPNIHLHARPRAVGRRREIGVAGSATILRLRPH
jgi:hypothetical protein